VTYAESGLFWSQCFLPSLVIRKAQAGAGKSSLGLLCLGLVKLVEFITQKSCVFESTKVGDFVLRDVELCDANSINV
jgi:hypothetical protein